MLSCLFKVINKYIINLVCQKCYYNFISFLPFACISNFKYVKIHIRKKKCLKGSVQMKKLMFLISITLMMFLAVECQGDDDESGLGEIDVDVVAPVNGEDITADDLLEIEQFLIDNYEMAG